MIKNEYLFWKGKNIKFNEVFSFNKKCLFKHLHPIF